MKYESNEVSLQQLAIRLALNNIHNSLWELISKDKKKDKNLHVYGDILVNSEFVRDPVNLTRERNIVIVGAGGLGLMAIQLAKAISGSQIIALDLNDDKLNVAKENGADIILNSKKKDPIKAIMELTSNLGADAVIDFVNSTKSVETDMQILRRRARLVLVGLFGGELKLNLITMPTKAFRLIGSYTGTLNELAGLLSLAERGVINPVVTDRFKLEEATEGLSQLKEGNIIGRGVINP